RIYFVTLSKETPSPFRPKSDEVDTGQKEEKKDDKPAAKDAKGKETPPLQIDTDGIQDRILQLPVQPASYRNVQVAGNSVYYLRKSRKDASPVFFLYDLANQKETQLSTSVTGFEISSSGQKMLIGKRDKYAIIDLP